MLSASTIEILKKLSPHELKKFGDFVNSPYFNTTSSLEIIYKIVLKAHPDYTSDSLKSESMSDIIFGKGEYKEKRLKNLCSEFGNLLKKFIGYEIIAADKQELDVHISKGLLLKQLCELSSKHISKSKKENDDGLISVEGRFFSLCRMCITEIENIDNLGMNGTSVFSKLMGELIEMLTIFYSSVVLRFSLYDNVARKVFTFDETPVLNEVHNFLDIKKILEYLKKTNNQNYSLVKIHYLFYYYSFNDINEEQYLELKDEIFDSSPKFSKEDALSFIYSIFQLIHLKAVLINRDYLGDVLVFTDLIRKLNIYPDEKREPFSHTLFWDIFAAALMLKNYDWAEKFVNEFVNYITAARRENTGNYFSGILNFQRGRYELSLEFFSKIKTNDIIQKINVRFYYLMNYIELRAYENALSALTTIKQFCQDSKEIPELFREKVESSLKYFNDVIRCELKNEKLDKFIYDTALRQAFIHNNYIWEKMEKLV